MRLSRRWLALSLAAITGCGAYDARPAVSASAPSPGGQRQQPEAAAGYPQQAPGSTPVPAAEPAPKKSDLAAQADGPARNLPVASTPASPPAGTTSEPAADVATAPKRDLVIYTARITMSVYQVEQGLAEIEKIARANGGYLGQKKDREITVRVPRARFEAMLASVDRVGDVLHREISAEDVTDEHVDTEIRIRNARAMQHRLTELLARANVKDALEIEKELHRVTEELERLEGRLKVMKDRIAFSTITVAFEPRGATLPSARVRLPFAWLHTMNLPSLLQLSEDK